MGEPVTCTLAKMSKSKHNGVDPIEIIGEFGADAARVFMLFKAPPDMVLEWDTKAIQGVVRWLQRVWGLVYAAVTQLTGPGPAFTKEQRASLRAATHLAIRGVTHSMSTTHSFNAAVAELMKLSNTLCGLVDGDRGTVPTAAEFHEALRVLLVLLAPLAPHVTAELWQHIAALPAGSPAFRPEASVHAQRWPAVDPAVLQKDTLDIKLQVGGRFRGVVAVPLGVAGDAEALQGAVLASDLARRWVGKASIARVVVSPAAGVVSVVLGQAAS